MIIRMIKNKYVLHKIIKSSVLQYEPNKKNLRHGFSMAEIFYFGEAFITFSTNLGKSFDNIRPKGIIIMYLNIIFSAPHVGLISAK